MPRLYSLLLLLLLKTYSSSSQPFIHYEETFDNNTNGWAVWDNEWNSARFEKGQYVYEMKGNYSHQTWNNGIRFDVNRDFAIETKFSLLNGKPGETSFWLEWGLANIGRDYYAFGIYSDGTFQYGKAVNSNWKAITEKPVTHAAILNGLNKINVLRMERSGTSLTLRINGTEVYKTGFESINPTTATGFQANGSQRVAVDYLRIFQDPPANNASVYKIPAARLFPVFKSLDKDTEWKNGYLFTGTAAGNCEEGKGTFLEVYLERWDENRGKLKYKIYKGDFAKKAGYFNGTIYYAEIIVIRKNTRKDFEPEKGPFDFSFPEKTCSSGESGEMKLTGVNTLYPGVRNYNMDGQASAKMLRLNNADVFTQSYYHNNQAVYMYQKDNAGNQFWGLVGYSFEKIAGYELKADGTIYTGGFYNNVYFGPGRRTINGKTEEGIWNRGGLIAAQPVYIPDTNLLKKAAKEIAGNWPFRIKIDPLNADEYLDNGFGGRMYNEKGEETTFIQNGNGLVLGFEHQFYFGHFTNGKADGIGLFAVIRWGERNYAISPNVYGGYFEQGKFMVGPAVHKTRHVEIGKDIMALFSTVSSDPNFLEERDMMRKGNYSGAIKGFRAKAEKGITNAASLVTKFNEIFYNKEDFYVNKPSTLELQQSLDLYFTGKPADAFKALSTAADRGDAEAMYYLAGFYEKGIGVEQHIGKSDEYYRKSVQGGYTRSSMPLARKYLNLFEGMLRYGVDFNVSEDDSAMKYYLTAAQSQPATFISPAEIQEARMGYYRTKYPGLRNSIGINIQLGDDSNPNTYFGQIVANDKANKQRQADLQADMLASVQKTAGKYYQHQSSHQIVYIPPSSGGSYMVTAIYVHNDNARNFTSTVSVKDLQNPSFYREVNFNTARACNACKGEGVIRTSYKRTVADYEYTLGVKVEASGSNASRCLACGGGGLQVN
ncbi:MAG: sel1 repeat family protein [Chitinophagaceae bacterium]|nr:sel1 repeat family protein [Chitinophagaceae bacterium]